MAAEALQEQVGEARRVGGKEDANVAVHLASRWPHNSMSFSSFTLGSNRWSPRRSSSSSARGLPFREVVWVEKSNAKLHVRRGFMDSGYEELMLEWRNMTEAFVDSGGFPLTTSCGSAQQARYDTLRYMETVPETLERRDESNTCYEQLDERMTRGGHEDSTNRTKITKM